MLARMQRKRISFVLLVGMRAGQPLWITVWRFRKILKIEIPYDPAIALLGIYPWDTGVLFQRGTYTSMYTAALSTIAKVRKEPKCPSTDEWIKKKWYIYATSSLSTHPSMDIWALSILWLLLIVLL